MPGDEQEALSKFSKNLADERVAANEDREALIEKLRAEIRNGTYVVDDEALAAALLRQLPPEDQESDPQK